jgi:hypothetical protein
MFQKINLINALSLMCISVWMYNSSVNPSIIHLLPIVAGVILLALNNGIRAESKEQKNVAFYFTVILVFCFALLLFTDIGLKEEGFLILVISLIVLSLLSAFSYIFEQWK